MTGERPPAPPPARGTSSFYPDGAEVTSLGGSTPWDTPDGRMAVVADDHGAVFSVIMAPAGGA